MPRRDKLLLRKPIKTCRLKSKDLWPSSWQQRKNTSPKETNRGEPKKKKREMLKNKNWWRALITCWRITFTWHKIRKRRAWTSSLTASMHSSSSWRLLRAWWRPWEALKVDQYTPCLSSSDHNFKSVYYSLSFSCLICTWISNHIENIRKQPMERPQNLCWICVQALVITTFHVSSSTLDIEIQPWNGCIP